jgi:hypothetical protein
MLQMVSNIVAFLPLTGAVGFAITNNGFRACLRGWTFASEDVTMNDTATLPTPQKPARPLGVWFLTLYAAIFDGILPLLLAGFILITGQGGGGAVNLLNLFVTLILCGGVIYAAIGTWRGEDRARKLLLVMVTLYYAMTAITALFGLATGLAPEAQQSLLIRRVIRAFILPAFYFWYFRRWEIRDFYKK